MSKYSMSLRLSKSHDLDYYCCVQLLSREHVKYIFIATGCLPKLVIHVLITTKDNNKILFKVTTKRARMLSRFIINYVVFHLY